MSCVFVILLLLRCPVFCYSIFTPVDWVGLGWLGVARLGVATASRGGDPRERALVVVVVSNGDPD